MQYPFEPQHDKTNKMTCALNEDSDEPQHDKTNKMSVHPAKTQISLGICPSDQSLRCPHEETLGP